MNSYSRTELEHYVGQFPQDPAGWYQLGILLFNQGGNYQKAADCLEKCLQLDPGCAHTKSILGLALLELSQIDRARSVLETAVRESDNDPNIVNNLVAVLMEMGDMATARSYLTQLINTLPDDPFIQFNLGYIDLYDQHYTTGFRYFEARLQLPHRRRVPNNRWQGQSLDRKTLYLIAEEGYGDMFQMFRYAHLLKAAYPTATIIAEVYPGMETLASAQPYFDALVTAKPDPVTIPDRAYSVPFFSLPCQLAQTVDTLHAPVPYITPAKAPYPALDQIFATADTRPRIGVVWDCSAEFRRQQFKQLPFASIAELSLDDSWTWWSLQKGNAESVFKTNSAHHITPLGSALSDWGATSAAITQLDLVITCDTGVAHLAAALGKPVWMALSAVPDWRWSHTRTDSPWYPTLRLFRQTTLGDWAPVFQAIKAALHARSPQLNHNRQS